MNYNQFQLVNRLALSLVSLSFVLIICSCIIKSELNATETTESLPEEKNIVETIVLEEQDFTREIVSNGKLSAFQCAELYFELSGFIENINVKNGQNVSKDFQLANIQNTDFQFSLRKAEVAKEQAEIERLDALIGMGYKNTD